MVVRIEDAAVKLHATAVAQHSGMDSPRKPVLRHVLDWTPCCRDVG